MALQTNSSKNDTTVTIGGKTYTLSGYESENYLQEVASYLNTKIAEIRNDRELQKLPFEMRNVLLQLNIADDYFKARSEADKVHVRMGEKDQNLSDVKHDLVAAQMKLESAEKKNRSLEAQLQEALDRIEQLEQQVPAAAEGPDLRWDRARNRQRNLPGPAGRTETDFHRGGAYGHRLFYMTGAAAGRDQVSGGPAHFI